MATMKKEDWFWVTIFFIVFLVVVAMFWAMFATFKRMKDEIHNTIYTVRLADNREVTCRGYSPNNCGVHLYRCDDGREYTCQTNVIILKKELIKE